MSIPLTLGVPDRPDPQALIAGLLQRRFRSWHDVSAHRPNVSSGPPVIAASTLRALPKNMDLGRIVVELDEDPDELRRADGSTYEVVRFHVHVDDDTLSQALELRLPSPLVVFPRAATSSGPSSVSALEAVTAIVEAHRTPGFAASAAPRHIADVLAVVAHADVGFVARAESSRDVLAILAATVAALRGDDILAALASPDLRALAALRPEAAAAVRTVLLGIEIDDEPAAHRELEQAGLVRPSTADGPPQTT